MRRLLSLPVALTALVAVGAPAWAAWVLPAGTGTGSAGARSLTAATNPAASAAGSTVTITWTNGSNPGGTTHTVVRNSSPAVTLSCTATPCTDSGVPNGTYTYTISPALQSWTGAGATTAPVTVAVQTAPPSLPTMLAADDSGASNSDHITRVARPRFTGTAAANGLVRLYRGTAEIGSVQLTGGSTTWTITPSADLAEGTASITATAQVSGQAESAASQARNATFDRTAPAAPTVTSPTEGATKVSRSTSFAGTAGESGGTVTVTITAGTSGISPVTATPGSSSPFSWTTGSVGQNALTDKTKHSAEATHTDVAGNTSTKATVNFET